MRLEIPMITRVVRTTALMALVAVLLTGMTGCKGKKPQAIDPNLTAGNNAGGSETSSGNEMPEMNEAWLFNPATGLQTVYFDYDSYDLRTDALSALRDNADKIKNVPNTVIQIEGHCDERGTQEYNLALGEKRALAVRSHLMNLGVSGDRIVTISYGEEDPADPSSNEGAWSKNRRCEFNKAM